MGWGTNDMKPDLNPDDLVRLGASGIERAVVDFILPCMRTEAQCFPQRVPSDATLRTFAMKAIGQGYTVKTILDATKAIPDRFERFPSYLEFVTLLRSRQTVKTLSLDDPKESVWFNSLSKATTDIIQEYGREKVEGLAEQYSQGVYGCSLGKWGEWKENIIRLFINDRQRMGKDSNMGQIIAYAKAKSGESVKSTQEEITPQPTKPLYTRGSADDF